MTARTLWAWSRVQLENQTMPNWLLPTLSQLAELGIFFAAAAALTAGALGLR
jgi:hypothetical protein